MPSINFAISSRAFANSGLLAGAGSLPVILCLLGYLPDMIDARLGLLASGKLKPGAVEPLPIESRHRDDLAARHSIEHPTLVLRACHIHSCTVGPVINAARL